MKHERLARRVSGAIAGALLAAVPAHAGTTVTWGGNVYEYVDTYAKWNDAKAMAESMSYLGYAGRLATITSAGEQAAIESIIPTHWSYNAMLGGSDAEQEGTWKWVTGPEAGTIFWKDGAPYDGAYTFWRPGEPNAYSPSEDYLVLYEHKWIDSPANDFYHRGFVVEYELENHGFDFGMTDNHMLAVQNLSPTARLVGLDIRLPGDTFIDSGPCAPGLDYARWSLVDASPGAGYTLPDSKTTDGKQTVSLALDLDPTEAVVFDVDFDRLSGRDGAGMVLGTQLLAHFLLGDIAYEVPGTVVAGGKTILGNAFTYSVRAMYDEHARVPEPTAVSASGTGLLALLALARRRRAGANGSATPRA